MISDEMRELLSTYVDGELKHNDAARVEDMSKRDPELRREIEAYRILRRQLKAWDAADNDVTPPPTLRERALERVRAYVHATGLGARTYGAVWALAAGLLLAVGLGVVVAGAGSEPGPVVVQAKKNVLPTDEWVPYEGVRRSEAVVSLRDFKQKLPKYEPVLPVFKGLENYLRNGRRWTRKSIDLEIEWSAQHRHIARVMRDHPELKETRTGTWRPEIVFLVSPYEAASVPLESLVVFRHHVGLDTPEVLAMPTGADVADDYYSADRLLIDTRRLARGHSRLLLAGEIFVGSRDKSNRVRVVSASSWVQDSSDVPMAWADNVKTPGNAGRLVLQAEMLGPKARRAIARGQSLPKGAVEALRAGRKTQANAVARLVASLRVDASATGFAVVAGKQVLGVELFASHDLMLAYAPRLLHGYLAEAGTKAIRLTEPTQGGERIQELARMLIDRVSQSALKLQDVKGGTTGEWPAKKGKILLRRVNIMAGRTAVAGHGLLYKGRPLHITLFADR